MKVIHLISGYNNKAPVKVAKNIVDYLSNDVDIKLRYIFDSKCDATLKDKEVKKLSGSDLDADIFHSHGVYSDIICFIICKTLRKKHISTVHCNPEVEFGTGIKAKIIKKFWLFLLSKIDHVIFLSNYIKDQYLLINSDVIYNGIAVKQIDKKSKLKFERNGRQVIFLFGVLRQIKGFEQVIRAANKDLVILIAGEGDYMQSLKEEARVCNVEDNVVFLGYLNDPVRFINHDDIVIFPSRSEGFPLALLEVMSIAKKPILSNIPVFNELSKDIDCNIFRLDDISDLKRVISDVIKKDDYNSEKNLSVVSNKYTNNIMADKYLVVYDKIYKVCDDSI
ncbi:TPA: glycosyltransferase family 4 protein [Photobacterium damselae]